VATIQNQVNERLLATEDVIIEEIKAIEAAAGEANVDANLLTEARELHRQAQLRWDFISAENSMGFHNPEEALRILAIASDLARQAQLKAIQAAGSPSVIQTSMK
jgi:nitrite reductase (cytochrome c-552)